jgi:hypothetical protein
MWFDSTLSQKLTDYPVLPALFGGEYAEKE